MGRCYGKMNSILLKLLDSLRVKTFALQECLNFPLTHIASQDVP